MFIRLLSIMCLILITSVTNAKKKNDNLLSDEEVAEFNGPTCDINLTCSEPESWQGLTCNNDKIKFLISTKVKRVKKPYISNYSIKFYLYTDLNLTTNKITWQYSHLDNDGYSFAKWSLDRQSLELLEFWKYGDKLLEILPFKKPLKHQCKLTTIEKVLSKDIDKILAAKKNNKI